MNRQHLPNIVHPFQGRLLAKRRVLIFKSYTVSRNLFPICHARSGSFRVWHWENVMLLGNLDIRKQAVQLLLFATMLIAINLIAPVISAVVLLRKEV